MVVIRLLSAGNPNNSYLDFKSGKQEWAMTIFLPLR